MCILVLGQPLLRPWSFMRYLKYHLVSLLVNTNKNKHFLLSSCHKTPLIKSLRHQALIRVMRIAMPQKGSKGEGKITQTAAK